MVGTFLKIYNSAHDLLLEILVETAPDLNDLPSVFYKLVYPTLITSISTKDYDKLQIVITVVRIHQYESI